MIICKHCNTKTEYNGNPCPACGKKILLDSGELAEILAEQKKAIKERRPEDALRTYKRLASEGYAEAEIAYAEIFESGSLAERNLNLATEYYKRAAEKNNAYAAYKYSRLLTRENDESARFWLIYSSILGCTESYPVTAEEFESRGKEEQAHYFYALAAECKDTESIVKMAKRYYNGIGTEQNASYAKWYMDKLRIPPIYAIKLAYKLRREVAEEPPTPLPKDYDTLLRGLRARAREYGFKTAHMRLSEILSERGDIDAATFIGTSMLYGNGCEKNVTEGLRLLTKASAHGRADAHVALGDFYVLGNEGESNPTEALRHYEAAGEQKCAEGYYKAAKLFHTGAMPRSIKSAVKLYEMAAALGMSEAENEANAIKRERESLYRDAIKGKASSPEEIFDMLSRSADLDYAPAAYGVGLCLEYGKGVKKSRHGAYLAYQKGAELGSAEATFRIGLCYANGFGTNRNFSLARAALIKAERSGVKDASAAIHNLMHKKIKKLAHASYSAAMRLFHQRKFDLAKNRLEIAAELSHPKAIYTLGCLYEFGIGTKCDKELAYSLYEKSFALLFRDPRARYKLSILRVFKSAFKENL